MMHISFSQSNRPQTSVIMINGKSFILKVNNDGLRRTNTVCPQDDVDYDLKGEEHHVKIVGVDIV